MYTSLSLCEEIKRLRASSVSPAVDDGVRAFIDSPEVEEVLRWMCFQVMPIVAVLRAGGVEIKKRAEDEQAAAMRWMLHHVAQSGPDWRTAADRDLNARRRTALAKEQS